MDWLGVASFWLGAAIMAIKSGDVPVLAGAPSWLGAAWWNLVPLVLMSLGGVTFLFRAIQRPSSAPTSQDALIRTSPSRVPLNDNDYILRAILICGILGLAFVALLIFSGRAQISQRAPRVELPFLQGAISRESLSSIISSPSPDQRDKYFQSLIGKNERIVGSVYSTEEQGGSYDYKVTLTMPNMSPQVYLIIKNASSVEAGQHIAATCKIERADQVSIGLIDCKVD